MLTVKQPLLHKVPYFGGGQSLAIDTSIKAFGPASHLLPSNHTKNQPQTSNSSNNSLGRLC